MKKKTGRVRPLTQKEKRLLTKALVSIARDLEKNLASRGLRPSPGCEKCQPRLRRRTTGGNWEQALHMKRYGQNGDRQRQW